MKLIYFVLIFFSLSAQAKINSLPNNKYHVRAGFIYSSSDIGISPRESSSEMLTFRPNTIAQSYLGVHISGLFGVSWGFSLKQPEDSIEDKGKTTYKDFRFHFAFEKFLISANYSNYKGLYLDKGSAPYTRYEDMDFQNISLDIVYALSPKRFSLPAIFKQISRQELSGGSWLLATSISENSINNYDTPFLTGHGIDFGSDQNMTAAKFQNLHLYAGGGYSFIANKAYYLNFTGLIGAGLQKSKISLDSSSYNKWDSSLKTTINIGFGYNGLDYFSGFNAYSTSIKNKSTKMNIESTNPSVSLFIGSHL